MERSIAQLDAAGVEYTIDQIDSFNRHVDNGWGAMNYDTLKSRAVLVSLGKDKGDKSILIWPAKSALDLKSIARGVGQAFVGTLENGEWIETTKETWNRIMARGRALLSLDENDFVRCIEMDFPGFRACEDSWLARGFREARTGWEKPSKKRGVKQMKVDDETREDIVGGVMTSSVVISAGRGESEVSIKTSSKKRPRLTSERASDDESAVAGNRVGPESRVRSISTSCDAQLTSTHCLLTSAALEASGISARRSSGSQLSPIRFVAPRLRSV